MLTKLLIFSIIPLLLIVPGIAFGEIELSSIPISWFKISTNAMEAGKSSNGYANCYFGTCHDVWIKLESEGDLPKQEGFDDYAKNISGQKFYADLFKHQQKYDVLIITREFEDSSFEKSIILAQNFYNDDVEYLMTEIILDDLPPYVNCSMSDPLEKIAGGICNIGNYVVDFIVVLESESSDQTSRFHLEDFMREFANNRYVEMQNQYKRDVKEFEKTKRTIQNVLDGGFTYDLSNKNANIMEIYLHEKDNLDLLEIEFDYKSTETNNQNPLPFLSIYGTEIFSLDYQSWQKYTRIHSDDYTYFGTVIPGNTDWNVECNSYFAKVLNPNIPYKMKACFEIPKNLKYFVFEGEIFSKVAAETIVRVDESQKSNTESQISTQPDPISDYSQIDSIQTLNTKPTESLECGTGTHEENGKCVVNSRGGGCLIATATFDSELAPQVQKLREIRDSKLLQTESGTGFMEHFNTFYYSFSPIIADYERENPVFKEIVKVGITPMISTLSLMDYADTESEVLGIGISLIILNAMMYVGLPVFGIMRLRK